VRRDAQDLRILRSSEDGAPLRLGFKRELVLFRRGRMARVVVFENVELFASAVQIAREQEQLEEEESGRSIGRFEFDLRDLGVNGTAEPAVLEQVVRGHGQLPSWRAVGYIPAS